MARMESKSVDGRVVVLDAYPDQTTHGLRANHQDQFPQGDFGCVAAAMCAANSSRARVYGLARTSKTNCG